MSDQASRVEFREDGDNVIISIFGYFDQKLGKEMNAGADSFLRAKKNLLVLDLANCAVVNSLGIAQIIELAAKTGDDYKGKLVIANAKPVMIQVFELSNVTLMAGLASSLEEARRELEKGE